MPPNPPNKAHGKAMRSMSLRDMQISKSPQKILAPPLPNPGTPLILQFKIKIACDYTNINYFCLLKVNEVQVVLSVHAVNSFLHISHTLFRYIYSITASWDCILNYMYMYISRSNYHKFCKASKIHVQHIKVFCRLL